MYTLPFRTIILRVSLCCVFFLGSFPVMAQRLSCDHWNTPRFFKRAGISLVEKCIATHDVHVRDEWGNYPLHHALMYRHDPNIVALVNAGAKVNSVNDAGETSMHIAANYSLTVDTLDLLLRKGAKVNVQDDFGENAPTLRRRIQQHPFNC